MNFYPIFWKDMLLITKKPGKFLAASMVTPLLYLVTFGWGLGRGMSMAGGRTYLDFVMPGLLGTLRTNLRLGRRDVAVFELGRVFEPAGAGVRERRRLAVLLSGITHPHHWSIRQRPFDPAPDPAGREHLGRVRRR